MQLIYIFLGGGTGSLLRYAVALLLHHYQLAFPLATLTANALSCLLLGFLASMGSEGFISPSLRSFFVIGLCGGFSTFSTFSFETLNLLQCGRYSMAFVNIALSITLCMLCLLIGFRLARTLL